MLTWILTAVLAVSGGKAEVEGSPTLALAWNAPASCPQRDAVMASVRRRLAPGPLEPGTPLEARVTVVELGEGFRLTLETQPGARRELSGPSCVELSEAGALILALLVDPMLLSRPPPPEPAPVEEPLRRFSGALAVSAVADYGALPSVTAGWHASLLLDFKALHVEAFGGTFVPQHVANTAAPAQSATLALDFDVGVRPCWNITSTRVRPLLCAALSLGRTSGSGSGVTDPKSGTSLYAGVFLGAGAAIELFWRLGLLVHVDAGTPLVRTFVGFEDGQPLHATPLFLARGEVALTARLW